VLCVLMNKYLFQFYAFNYATFLTFLHMASNSLFIVITEKLGYFERKQADWMKVLPIGCSFVASVVSLNLSLQYNSVGFFQVMKILIIPCLVVMNWIGWNKRSSVPILLSLIPIMIGVAICTVSEINFSAIGAMYAIIGCFTTALHQIWGQTKQKELSLDALQLLSYQAPISAVILIPLTFMIDDVWGEHGIYNYPWPTTAITVIVGSCIAAFGVNITSYMIVGKASPLTYQVLGHFKTCCVLAFGMIYYDSNVATKNVIGIAIAFLGTMIYSHITLQVPTSKPPPTESTKH